MMCSHSASKLALGLASLAAAALLAPAGSTEAAGLGAKICKNWVSGRGKGADAIHARHFALGDWMAKVKAAHGAAYASPAQAQIGAFVCNPAQGQTFCTIRARPCGTPPLMAK